MHSNFFYLIIEIVNKFDENSFSTIDQHFLGKKPLNPFGLAEGFVSWDILNFSISEWIILEEKIMGFNNIMQLEVHICFFRCSQSIFVRVLDNSCFMIMMP
jgi:hypothetical protein